MSTNNDQRILELKKQIEEKKEKLGSSKTFSPITNCSIDFEGVRHNLRVLGTNDLITLMVKVNACLISAKELGLEDKFKISGYKAEDWITDMKSKLAFNSIKEEEVVLKAMEDKLTKLLSEDKKVELELNEIANLLK